MYRLIFKVGYVSQWVLLYRSFIKLACSPTVSPSSTSTSTATLSPVTTSTLPSSPSKPPLQSPTPPRTTWCGNKTSPDFHTSGGGRTTLTEYNSPHVVPRSQGLGRTAAKRPGRTLRSTARRLYRDAPARPHRQTSPPPHPTPQGHARRYRPPYSVFEELEREVVEKFEKGSTALVVWLSGD